MPLTVGQLQEKFNKYKKTTDAQLKTLKSQLEKKSALDQYSPDDNRMTITDVQSRFTEQTRQTQEAIKDLDQAGMRFKDRGFFEKALTESLNSIDLLMGSTKLAKRSFEDLAKGLQSFGEMVKIQGPGVESLTAKLAKHQAVLHSAGLSTRQFQQIVETSTFSLKESTTGVENLNLRLADFARSSGVSTEKVSRNFNMLAKNLMIDSANIERELVRTQKIEQQTGVSVSDQQRAFSGVTTDFSAASQMAGNLNALLGGNKLSATEIFMSLTPGEVQEKIKEALKGTRMEDDLTYSGDDRNRLKARQLAIATLAKNTNMSADNVRRMYGLKEGDKDSVQGQLIKSTDKTFEQFDNGLGKASMRLDDFANMLIVTQRGLSSAFDIRARARYIDQTRKDPTGLQQAAFMREYGFTRGATTSAVIGADGRDRLLIAQLNELRQIESIKPEEAERLTRRILTGESGDANAARAQASNLINRAQNFKRATKDISAMELQLMKSPGTAPMKRRIRAGLDTRKFADFLNFNKKTEIEIGKEGGFKNEKERKEALEKLLKKDPKPPKATKKTGASTSSTSLERAGSTAALDSRMLQVHSSIYLDSKLLGESITQHYATG
ncbi:hypothetical protein OAA64_00845 [bacterium]|nr:hypothetical protein [bacterium]